MSPPPTLQVLDCDPSSISFSSSLESSDLPKVSSERTLDALKHAAHRLVDIEDVVAFPTETVYGLGANALSSTAVSRIFSTKGRPQDNPLIVHISSLPMLRRLLPQDYKLSPVYQALVKAFWPGPLTLLFPADSKIVPPAVTAGHPSVAVRMPSHPVARAVVAMAGVPLAAPSANVSGKPSATRAEHVINDLGATGRLRLVLDGGACPVGVESTVVDGLGDDGNLRVLRPGGVTVEDLEHVVESMDMPNGKRPKVLNAPTTPGMKYRHYSPSIPVALLMAISKPPNSDPTISYSTALTSLIESRQNNHHSGSLKVGLLAPSDSPLLQHKPHSADCFTIEHFPLGSRSDPATSAARLFDGLLTLEKNGADIILVEEISEEREGLAFMNRARKAAGIFIYIRDE
ncbi:translation factor [Fomitiporia mediterranea MF3/22]|uniref:translation factor n=1 Tax=Fomitiporia mediterranea (strain MF3/22) TaxID=694068 RepID=UPI00044083E5|nr:translation factor [Fomitiporia mediterranea MF3/22]EJD01648.1 translation factor [Fomitiporia mediterranea MF3/22]